MRSFSKSKFSQCFRPVVDLDDLLESKVVAHHHSKNKHTVLKVIKAMVLETILNRRARHKTCYGFDCFGVSKHNYSTYKKVTNATQSSLTSLSSDNSTVSQSKNMSTKGKHEKETKQESAILEKQKKFEFRAICLVLISLVFTVFFGKLFGIFLTSIWIFLFSLCNSNYRCRKMLPYGARYSVVHSPKYMDVNGHYRK
ncbi:hypothetical protein MtrunA17_Chr4g0022951 [Medicago truncatula]|uniref:Transmembrane protein, putative n=1 Tax=Medicago truncatula TaxID=3880 RepID=A0A072TIM5_MEDTR|nr:uncharacterized protein LOC25479982 [Medicago truncatula]KEH17066.1 transmembrane protein, putative [Medicago truncatula]RHN60196.1 hypothetical protein MtrunA17_Chr4g0022951 [Medicago truncatula]